MLNETQRWLWTLPLLSMVLWTGGYEQAHHNWRKTDLRLSYVASIIGQLVRSRQSALRFRGERADHCVSSLMQPLESS